MHLAPIFCGAAGWGHIEQLRQALVQPPNHSGWMPLSWPPVMMTLVGSIAAADMPIDAAEVAARFIDASYRSTDSHEIDPHGGLPGVTREYRQLATVGKWGEYVNAGIEGYGWGALSVYLLMRYIIGLREEEAGKITLAPAFPQSLRRAGAVYQAGPIPWGKYELHVTCTVQEPERYHMRVKCLVPLVASDGQQLDLDALSREPVEQQWEWDGIWGEPHAFQLP